MTSLDLVSASIASLVSRSNLAISDGAALNEALRFGNGNVNIAVQKFNDLRFEHVQRYQMLEEVLSFTPDQDSNHWMPFRDSSRQAWSNLVTIVFGNGCARPISSSAQSPIAFLPPPKQIQ